MTEFVISNLDTPVNKPVAVALLLSDEGFVQVMCNGVCHLEFQPDGDLLTCVVGDSDQIHGILYVRDCMATC